MRHIFHLISIAFSALIFAIGLSGDTHEPQVGKWIPYLEGITIDGDGDDWAEQGFRVEAFADRHGYQRPVDDLDVRMSLGWDEGGPLMLLEVRDDHFIEFPTSTTSI